MARVYDMIIISGLDKSGTSSVASIFNESNYFTGYNISSKFDSTNNYRYPKYEDKKLNKIVREFRENKNQKEYINNLKNYFGKIKEEHQSNVCIKQARFKLGFMKKILPNSKFIYLYRNPKSVYTRLKRYLPLIKFLKIWDDYYSDVLYSYDDNVLLINYDDLIDSKDIKPIKAFVEDYELANNIEPKRRHYKNNYIPTTPRNIVDTWSELEKLNAYKGLRILRYSEYW